MYAGQAPWETGAPQPAFAELARAGAIAGQVLDSGCGTGENALLLASMGCRVVAVDFVPAAVASARAKAEARGLEVDFRVGDALELAKLPERFDVVIDSGVFHIFGDEDRRTYVEQLHGVLRTGGRAFIVCFSELEPGSHGPRRVLAQEIRAAFAEGWEIVSIEPTRYALVNQPDGMQFTPGGAHAWLTVVRRCGRAEDSVG